MWGFTISNQFRIIMRTRKFKTLRGLLKAKNIPQISMENLLSGQFCDKHYAWYRFTLPDDVKRELIYNLCDCINLRGRESVWHAFCRGEIRTAGILSRLWAELSIAGNIRYTYCAGQDWDAETRTVRSILHGH